MKMKLYVTYSWIVLAVAFGLSPVASASHEDGDPAAPPKGGHPISASAFTDSRYEALKAAIEKNADIVMKDNLTLEAKKEDFTISKLNRDPLKNLSKFFQKDREQLNACSAKSSGDPSARLQAEFTDKFIAYVQSKVAPDKVGVQPGGLDATILTFYANKFRAFAEKRKSAFPTPTLQAVFEKHDAERSKTVEDLVVFFAGRYEPNAVTDEAADKHKELKAIKDEANAVMTAIGKFADGVGVNPCKMGASAETGATPTPTPAPKSDGKSGVTPTATATPVPPVEPTKKLQPAPPAGPPGKTDDGKLSPPTPGPVPIDPNLPQPLPGQFPGNAAIDPNALLNGLQNDINNKLNDFNNVLAKLAARDALRENERDRDEDVAAKLLAALGNQKKNDEPSQQQPAPQLALAPPPSGDKGQLPPAPTAAPVDPNQGQQGPNPFAMMPQLQPMPQPVPYTEPSPAPYVPKAIPVMPFGPPQPFNPQLVLNQLKSGIRADIEKARIEALRARGRGPMARRPPPMTAGGRQIPRPLPPGVRPPVPGVALRGQQIPGARTTTPFAVQRGSTRL